MKALGAALGVTVGLVLGWFGARRWFYAEFASLGDAGQALGIEW